MAKIKKIQEQGQTIYPATITQAIKDGVSGESLDKAFARQDGTYPKMSVGFAENLVGDGSATTEEFSFRPTATENRNVRDGAARIEKIKGNSVVLNQFASSISEIADFRKHLFSYNPEDSSFALIKENDSSNLTLNLTLEKIAPIAGHKYLLYTEGSGYENAVAYFGSPSYLKTPPYTAVIVSCTSNNAYFYLFAFGLDTTIPSGTSFILTKVILVDLTKMFGAGKEPTTVEEFYQRMPKGVDLNAYNEGEIVDGNYGAIKTTGYNQFNGTYAKVLGGYEYHLGGTYTSLGFASELDGVVENIELSSDGLYTPSQNGYIFAQGENIDIHFNWSEYNHLSEDYHPYQPFERDLSWLMRYFPATINGETKYAMRQAGSVRDEIRFNSTTQKWEAVQRVGVRAYTSGDEKDSTLTTDGTNTNYPLASVTPVEITENVNLDFDVSDYGTEELIAGNGGVSAPLVADIVYEPNVLATTKNQPDILKSIEDVKNKKQDILNIAVLNNGNIRITNLSGGGKDFMPATPSGDPMHYVYLTNPYVAYDSQTGLWSYMAAYGGLTDITTEEMRNMYIAAGGYDNKIQNYGRWANKVMLKYPARTNIVTQYYGGGQGYQEYSSCDFAFNQNRNIEVAVIQDGSPGDNNDCQWRFVAGLFSFCNKLRKIIGWLNFDYIYTSDKRYQNMFNGCVALQEVSLYKLDRDLSLSSSPLLTKESVLFMINNCLSNKTLTITLHPEVYAKCIEGGEWHSEVSEAIANALNSKGTTISVGQ